MPELLDTSVIDEVMLINDYESATACRSLLLHEGIFAGGSSGAVIAAITHHCVNPGIARERVITIPAVEGVLSIRPDQKVVPRTPVSEVTLDDVLAPVPSLSPEPGSERGVTRCHSR